MNRLWIFLFDTRVLSVLGLAALAAFLFLGADTLRVALVWAALAFAALLTLWGATWVFGRWRARRAGRALEQAIDEQAAAAAKAAPETSRSEVAALRGRLQSAIKTIKSSKLGQSSGSAALYELPWYMIIGNPAAGKSTAIVRSGLTFPFAGEGGNSAASSGHIIQGIGGTRNCDWFFTSEGILLDTAGRYSVHEEDRQEWLGFLDLLKKYRAKAPINGIVIAASAAELARGRPEQAIQLAKNLRQRVQELTERLEVFAPVYLVFTKADLIAGFADFFEDSERSERDRVWGASLPYGGADKPADALAQFETRFDELCEGLREMSVARMSLARGRPLPPGVLSFPLEFAAVKPALRAFVATLFEDNPYQFRPVFRGFFFTSAVQQGQSNSLASEQVAQQFGLRASAGAGMKQETPTPEGGFFLKDLFSRVIFGDRDLVRQYASRRKLQWRMVALGVGVVALAAALGAWSWAYMGNRQLMANVQADLDKAVKLQAEQSDLASRLQALILLQDRIEQLARYRQTPPLGLSLGLYQGDTIERKLREEYFAGIRQVMLQPVAQAIEGYLAEVNANPQRLKPMVRTPESGAAQAERGASRGSGTRFVDASPEDSADAYNALKTYLMLADRDRLEPSHLMDQITRFWRGWLDDNRGTMPREQMIRAAESLISFSTAQLLDPAFPVLSNQLALVDTTRDNLREVVKGMRGIERVYADIKARAATRFAPITVAGLLSDADRNTVAGSHAVPGPFTREAWDGYIEQAFKDAASKELQSVDWVLKTSARDDLTLGGSPEQIRKELTELYKSEYVAEWRLFMQGVTVTDFGTFEQAVERINRLGDPQQSPIRKLMQTLFDQTSWDNPSLLNERLASTQKGILDWFKQTILRQAPSRVDVNVNLQGPQATIPLGPIGREFAPLARIMMPRDNTAPPLQDYLQSLAKVRTRFNQIKNQGDPGPGARKLIAQTLEGGDSELTETLKLVDERLLNGMTDSARAALRPLLVRPLIQAMVVAVPPAEAELNRVWLAQVLEPFQRTLAGKYPFDPASRVEAGPAEVAKVFGPDGAVAKFSSEALGPLLLRRGDSIEPKKWAEVGIRLRPELASGFSLWVAPLDAALGGGAGMASTANTGATGGLTGSPPGYSADQTVFQILPQGSPGLSEYTLVIDGQTLRYRNTAPEWTQMVWPNPTGVAGARLSAITNDGRTVELVNEPGSLGLNRLFETAQRRKLPEGTIEMSWAQPPHQVTLHLKVLRLPGQAPAAAASGAAAARPTAGGTAPQAPLPAGGVRLKGVALPAQVVGSDAPVLAGPESEALPSAGSAMAPAAAVQGVASPAPRTSSSGLAAPARP